MVKQKVGNYNLKTATKVEMLELQTMIDEGCENHRQDRVDRYFHSFALKYPNGQTLQYYFPRERFFIDRLGETNYVIALLQYIGTLKC